MNNIDDTVLINLLVKGSYLLEADVQQAESEAKCNKVPLSQYLLRENLITKSLLGQAIAEYFNILYRNNDLTEISKETLELIPEIISKKHRVFVIDKNNNEVSLGTDNPKIIDEEILRRVFPTAKFHIYYVFPDDVDRILLGSKHELEVRFAKLLLTNSAVAPDILEEILGDAILHHASDIHFEPTETNMRVRFRIDGQLKEMATIPLASYQSVVRVIKNRAGLVIDEHLRAQDGAIRIHKEGSSTDLRISIVPTIDGEKIVIKLLSDYVKNLNFNSLGMSAEDEARIMAIAKNPYGMILTVGPTGSGKTTTLYSLIRALNKPDINITTIEDPVEYKIDGVNHIQTNEKTDLTFAKGLRSIIRQDPNIIFVGELRDKETAEIAADAALTGHIVLSTFHTNTASTAFPRLLDMGIEPFLLSSTLKIVIGQRLVRKICEHCKYSQEVSPAELKKIFGESKKYFPSESVTIYKGKGCSHCHNSGYRGRIAVFELVFSTPELQSLLLASPSSQQVWDLAKKQGAHSMFEDGVVKVMSGIISLEELLRVAKPTFSDTYKV